MPRYHTIFLDWDGTLCHDKFWQQWQSDQNYATFLAEKDKLFAQKDFIQNWMRGNETAESISQKLASATNLSASHILQGLRQSCETMALTNPALPHIITQLRATGMHVVIATDNMDTFVRWTMPALHLRNLFDDILDSYTLTFLKNDMTAGKPQFFRDYLDKHATSPSHTVLVDDSLSSQILEQTGMHFSHVTSDQPAIKILSELL